MAVEWCQVCGSSVWTGQPCGKCAHDGVVATRDAEIAALKAEVVKLRAWMHCLTDRLDEVLSTTRWDNHDNWCPAATDAFLPYKQNADTPPECNCVIRDGWRDVEGARKVLVDKKGGG